MTDAEKIKLLNDALVDFVIAMDMGWELDGPREKAIAVLKQTSDYLHVEEEDPCT